jgi:hypothetical protein
MCSTLLSESMEASVALNKNLCCSNACLFYLQNENGAREARIPVLIGKSLKSVEGLNQREYLTGNYHDIKHPECH